MITTIALAVLILLAVVCVAGFVWGVLNAESEACLTGGLLTIPFGFMIALSYPIGNNQFHRESNSGKTYDLISIQELPSSTGTKNYILEFNDEVVVCQSSDVSIAFSSGVLNETVKVKESEYYHSFWWNFPWLKHKERPDNYPSCELEITLPINTLKE
jgi:hypothetical protein